MSDRLAPAPVRSATAMPTPATSAPREYRQDIQGLRAIAVLSVVLYHANRTPLPGGFVGVDIFFVISGYLIAGILLVEIAQGHFSLAGFYERRVRRLFPALFTMLACVLAVGALTLTPQAYRELGHTALSTIVFASNVDFYKMSGYFHGDANFRPLLHTWSLAVEEQFYVAFPLMLFVLATWARKWLRPILWLGVLVSLAVSQWALERHAAEAFYLAPFRGYELLIGAALAGVAFPPTPRIVRDMLSLAGLAMIAGSLLLIHEATPFPGVAALLPCGGTALVLFTGAGGRSLGGRLISTPLFGVFGALSYSLYLWHWPVLVFGRTILLDEASPWQTALLLLAAVGVATLSWRLIEQPLLKRRGGRRRVLAYGGAAMVVGGCVAAAITVANGFPGRFDAEAQRMFAARQDFSPRRRQCHNALETLQPYESNCLFGAPGAAPRLAIWADSHGVELAATLGDRLAERGEALVAITASACPPALDYSRYDQRLCAAQNARTLPALVRDVRIDTVVFAADFAAYPHEDWPRLFDGLARSIEAVSASGKQVVLVYPIPVFAYDVPSALGVLAWRHQDPAAYGRSVATFKAANREAIEFLDRERARTGAVAVYPERLLCDDTLCHAFTPERGVLYFNRDHLSLAGARLLAEHVPLEEGGNRQ